MHEQHILWGKIISIKGMPVVSFRLGLFCWRLLYHSLELPCHSVEGPHGISTAGSTDTAMAGEWHAMN